MFQFCGRKKWPKRNERKQKYKEKGGKKRKNLV
jgi:hypothetical protein